MFSIYCERKFEVVPVEVVYSNGKTSVHPDLSLSKMEVSLAYITGSIGVELEANEVLTSLNALML